MRLCNGCPPDVTRRSHMHRPQRRQQEEQLDKVQREQQGGRLLEHEEPRQHRNEVKVAISVRLLDRVVPHRAK